MRMFKVAIIPTLMCGSEAYVGPSGPSGEEAAKFYDEVPENHLSVISKTAEEKHSDQS